MEQNFHFAFQSFDSAFHQQDRLYERVDEFLRCFGFVKLAIGFETQIDLPLFIQVQTSVVEDGKNEVSDCKKRHKSVNTITQDVEQKQKCFQRVI